MGPFELALTIRFESNDFEQQSPANWSTTDSKISLSRYGSITRLSQFKSKQNQSPAETEAGFISKNSSVKNIDISI